MIFALLLERVCVPLGGSGGEILNPSIWAEAGGDLPLGDPRITSGSFKEPVWYYVCGDRKA